MIKGASPDLEDDTAGLLKAVNLKVLQVSATIGHDENDEQLVIPECVHRVVLRAIALVPRMPLPD